MKVFSQQTILLFFAGIYVMFLAISAAELILYPGILANYTPIGYEQVFLPLQIAIGVIWVVGFSRGAFFRWFLRGTFVITLFLLAAYIYFSAVDQLSYPNYVYATYGIDVSTLQRALFGSCISMVTIAAASLRTSAYDSASILKNVALFLLILFLSGQLIGITRSLIHRYAFMVTHPTATYAERAEYRLPHYPYFQFIVQQTPDDAVIALPPKERPWYTVGNKGYVRQLLYPRYVTGLAEDGTVPEDVEYVVIAKGDWAVSDESAYGWPKQSIPTETIWLFDKETKEISEISGRSYEPDQFWYDKWGLIKVQE